MTTAELTADAINMLLVVLIVCVFVLGIIAVKGFVGEGMLRKRSIWFALVFGFLFMAYLVLHVLADSNLLADWDALSGLREILPADWAQIFLVLGLVTATGFYALMAFRQFKELREQRIITSRPIIIQKAVTIKVIPLERASDYFEIYNAGNGPAMEVEISLLLQREPPYKPHNCQREGFLRAGAPPIKFHTTFPPDVANSTFYIVSEYQGVSSYSPQPTWYQTWLPCKLSISGKVISGQLEFREVPVEKRIGIFSSEFNNGVRKK